ncbi:hypothetical protein V6N13_111020 [Hibiscus sabdariffa]
MQASQNPKSNPLYDIIILGASGFNTPSSPLKTLALAGRSHEKLTKTLRWAVHPSSSPPGVSIIIADTTDQPSLFSLCIQTKLLITLIGSLACLLLPLVPLLEAKYHEKAVDTGSLIVKACGFDSIPSEMGVMFNTRQWELPAVPNHVTAYFKSRKDAHVAVHIIEWVVPKEEGHGISVLKADMMLLKPDLFIFPHGTAMRAIPGSRPHKGPMIEYQDKIGLIAVKLPSADVVRRTLVALMENPLCFGWFRNTSPSEEEVRSASFKMWFIGYSFSDSRLAFELNSKLDMQIITRVMEPEICYVTTPICLIQCALVVLSVEICYVTTPICLIQCALVVLSQRENLPKGGVYTLALSLVQISKNGCKKMECLLISFQRLLYALPKKQYNYLVFVS